MTYPLWWGRVVDKVIALQEADPKNLPGAVLAAETQKDGRLITSIGSGWADDTICAIGSMTKPFTATAVLMALEEAGRLDAGGLVWQLPGMDAYASDPLKSQIKIRHLLQHTSGLPGFQPYSECASAPCNDPTGGPPGCRNSKLDLGPTAPWIGSPGYTNECILVDGKCQPARTASLEQVSLYVMNTYAPIHEPGLQYSYSTANFIIAGRIVEMLTGKSLNRYLREKLLDPLGMTDSFFIAQETGDPVVDARINEGISEGQRKRVADVTLLTHDGRMPPEIAPGPDDHWDKLRAGWRYVYPDGGMYSTAGNLLTFLSMLRDHGMHESRRILSPQVLSLLVEDQGFGHTLGLGYRGQGTPYGQGAGTVDYLGNIMTYFWLDPRPGNSLLGVFLSQRLTNVAVRNNMADGMKVIFRVFVPQVASGVLEYSQANPT